MNPIRFKLESLPRVACPWSLKDAAAAHVLQSTSSLKAEEFDFRRSIMNE